MHLYYNVYYSTSATGPWKLSNDEPIEHTEGLNTHIITNLQNNTQYFIAIVGGIIEDDIFKPLLTQVVRPGPTKAAGIELATASQITSAREYIPQLEPAVHPGLGHQFEAYFFHDASGLGHEFATEGNLIAWLGSQFGVSAVNTTTQLREQFEVSEILTYAAARMQYEVSAIDTLDELQQQFEVNGITTDGMLGHEPIVINPLYGPYQWQGVFEELYFTTSFSSNFYIDQLPAQTRKMLLFTHFTGSAPTIYNSYSNHYRITIQGLSDSRDFIELRSQDYEIHQSCWLHLVDVLPGTGQVNAYMFADYEGGDGYDHWFETVQWAAMDLTQVDLDGGLYYYENDSGGLTENYGSWTPTALGGLWRTWEAGKWLCFGYYIGGHNETRSFVSSRTTATQLHFYNADLFTDDVFGQQDHGDVSGVGSNTERQHGRIHVGVVDLATSAYGGWDIYCRNPAGSGNEAYKVRYVAINLDKLTTPTAREGFGYGYTATYGSSVAPSTWTTLTGINPLSWRPSCPNYLLFARFAYENWNPLGEVQARIVVEAPSGTTYHYFNGAGQSIGPGTSMQTSYHAGLSCAWTLDNLEAGHSTPVYLQVYPVGYYLGLVREISIVMIPLHLSANIMPTNP